jgi:hypothetical protein
VTLVVLVATGRFVRDCGVDLRDRDLLLGAELPEREQRLGNLDLHRNLVARSDRRDERRQAVVARVAGTGVTRGHGGAEDGVDSGRVPRSRRAVASRRSAVARSVAPFVSVCPVGARGASGPGGERRGRADRPQHRAAREASWVVSAHGSTVRDSAADGLTVISASRTYRAR